MLSQPTRDAGPVFEELARTQPPATEPVAAPMPHSIDFHAATVAPDDKYRMVRPGESIRFQWVANHPGVYMYHCGAPPALQHVAIDRWPT